MKPSQLEWICFSASPTGCAWINGGGVGSDGEDDSDGRGDEEDDGGGGDEEEDDGRGDEDDR